MYRNLTILKYFNLLCNFGNFSPKKKSLNVQQKMSIFFARFGTQKKKEANMQKKEDATTGYFY
jgi:hypothetical protein